MSKVLLIVVVFILGISIGYLGCENPTADAPGWGEYEGKVVVEWLNNGREMVLVNDFKYHDAHGKTWVAPAGSIIDGASIPRIFWSLVGGPLEGIYRDASVIHDVACTERKEKWQDTALVFYRAMRCSGVPNKKAKLLYYAVYKFGPRWDSFGPLQRRTKATAKQAEHAQEYIEQEDPSLRELRTNAVAVGAAGIIMRPQ